ncbi:DUF2971 domain-containing protein [Providencia sp. PROV_01]
MSFYKYMTTNTGKIVIENSTLRWSSPSIFNDIDECQFSPFSDSEYKSDFKAMIGVLADCAAGYLIYNINAFSPNTQLMIEMLKYVAKKNGDLNIYHAIVENILTDAFPNIGDYFRDYINRVIINCARVLCVTPSYANDLMWAHYADEHRGCVFEFDNLYKAAPLRLRQGNVQYVNELKSSTSAIELLLYGETKPINEALIRDVFFSKKIIWKYEKEYRLFFNEDFGMIEGRVNFQTNERTWAATGQSEQLYTDVEFSPESLLSITFGVRTQSAVIDEIMSIARSKNPLCKFYKMIRSDGSTIRQSI